ncbi:hypothetical protein LIA77_08711 [Sarocladium implicatum]|nr:hypothetical protein LIA77_08711 [Sarocladium implicatum]
MRPGEGVSDMVVTESNDWGLWYVNRRYKRATAGTATVNRRPGKSERDGYQQFNKKAAGGGSAKGKRRAFPRCLARAEQVATRESLAPRRITVKPMSWDCNYWGVEAAKLTFLGEGMEGWSRFSHSIMSYDRHGLMGQCCVFCLGPPSCHDSMTRCRDPANLVA